MAEVEAERVITGVPPVLASRVFTLAGASDTGVAPGMGSVMVDWDLVTMLGGAAVEVVVEAEVDANADVFLVDNQGLYGKNLPFENRLHTIFSQRAITLDVI